MNYKFNLKRKKEKMSGMLDRTEKAGINDFIGGLKEEPGPGDYKSDYREEMTTKKYQYRDEEPGYDSRRAKVDKYLSK